jgi:ribosomal protein L37E
MSPLITTIIRPRYRPCARCGRRVKVGEMDCPACGFDFRTVGA